MQQSPKCVPSMECPAIEVPRTPETTNRISQFSKSDSPQNFQDNLQSQVLDLHRCKRSRVLSSSEDRGKRDNISRMDVDSQAETAAQHPQRGSGDLSCNQVPNLLCAGRLHTGDSHGLPINNVAVEQRLNNPIPHQHNLETSSDMHQK